MLALRVLRSPVGTFLRYGVSLGLLGWLATRVEWVRLGELRALEATLTVPAVFFAGAAYPLQAWRWQVLLRALGIAVPTSWVQSVSWIGQFYNSFLPGGVAGDAVRLGWVWRQAPDRKSAGAASLLADRVLGLGALLVLAAGALCIHTIQPGAGAGLRPVLWASLAALAVLAAAGWSLAQTRWWQPLGTRVLGAERAAALQASIAALGARPGSLAGAAALSVAVWLADFLSLWLLARAVGLPAGLLEVSVGAAAAYVAASLPISIGGHGVREMSLVSVLGLLGYGGTEDGAVALLVAAFWTLSVAWSLVGGAVQLTALCCGWPGKPRSSTATETKRGPFRG
ncbi:MAG TPA: lysylphosphatidylglycerol synthase transmembrane domain-containing protein [Opitutaceae bacterium]|nr:lysylphosphatidylglycerol synthase transmembrane domain-containing protein [Opitutaceae bacterium]